MRTTFRLLANVKPARYLTPGNPTGLTGLYTHTSPRASLLFLYSQTLDKLQKFPESSLYRQSVEALTKHRMSIVEAAEPPGHKEWAERAHKIVQQNPDGFHVAGTATIDPAAAILGKAAGSTFIHRTNPQEHDIRRREWDGELDAGTEDREGLRGPEERESASFGAMLDAVPIEVPTKIVWESEPQLTADQVEEIENKIGAGLIEEVVQMAESELKLIDVMYENKVWESLEETPVEGQWEYFERKST
ncbi:ETC complex I subunit conserved region-domain-containing protein [Xylariaceae sp. FL0255]|nr:ETC complex I subunit conserved region-domain-containing protein [Xylariaceae sp. FL0255]